MSYRCQHFDNLLRWTVTSASRADVEHVVDLGAFCGYGQCSCEHFEFRIRPLLEAGSADPPTRCAHILAARASFTNDMIQRLSDLEEKGGA